MNINIIFATLLTAMLSGCCGDPLNRGNVDHGYWPKDIKVKQTSTTG